MDLYSGLPYWIVKNPLDNYYGPLRADHRCRVAVIGSGITGALVSHELTRAGIDCCVIDQRTLATGSSAASTAMLQYEIDVPLYKLSGLVGEKNAVVAYRECLRSIGELERTFREIGIDPSFERCPSLFYASNLKGSQVVKKEYAMRKKHGLPCELLSAREVESLFGFRAPGALFNRESARMDAYAGAVGLLEHGMRERGMNVFSHTRVTELRKFGTGWILSTDRGYGIQCDYVVVAAGFEAAPFLPGGAVELTTTFAVISQPVDPEDLWYENSLIWETRDPYLYVRTSGDRIIVGGEDENFNDSMRRRFLLEGKAAVLEKKFRKLFPSIPFKTDMAWSGTFSSTRDGLPLIGPREEEPTLLYALGYGGNGITFSMIAAQILANLVRGIPDSRQHVFGFERPSIAKKTDQNQ